MARRLSNRILDIKMLIGSLWYPGGLQLRCNKSVAQLAHEALLTAALHLQLSWPCAGCGSFVLRPSCCLLLNICILIVGLTAQHHAHVCTMTVCATELYGRALKVHPRTCKATVCLACAAYHKLFYFILSLQPVFSSERAFSLARAVQAPLQSGPCRASYELRLTNQQQYE
jgi:hypothetical protein